jgi:transcriptional regulator with XRE-family HTH domain
MAQSFGDWLKQRRKLLDLAQEELARNPGCAVTTVRKFESNDRRPCKSMVEHL